MTRLLASIILLLCVQHLAAAEMNSRAVSDGSGPLSGMSTNVGGRPVHDPGRSMREGSADRLSDGSVRGSANLNMSSGSLSELSVGAVRDRYVLMPNAAAAAGALANQLGSPQGEMLTQPQEELAPLQEQLRGVQPLPRDPSDTVESDDTPLTAATEDEMQADGNTAATEPQPEPVEPAADAAADADAEAATVAATDETPDGGEAAPDSATPVETPP